jgi:Flp pilus assembly protein TadG
VQVLMPRSRFKVERFVSPWIKALCQSERGTALVESAIILPVFLTLVGGVYEFSFYLYRQQMVATGVRDAARYLALTADPTSATNQVDAKNLALTGSINGGPNRVTGWTPADISIQIDTVDNTAATYSGGSVIRLVTVSTSFVDPSLGFFDLLGLNPPTMSVSHQERAVGGSAPNY